MMSSLHCKECDNYGRWNVWYKDFSSPTSPPFMPFNIAYNTFCDEHAIAELRNGRNDWHVECIKLVDDYHLPDDDRVKRKPK